MHTDTAHTGKVEHLVRRDASVRIPAQCLKFAPGLTARAAII